MAFKRSLSFKVELNCTYRYSVHGVVMELPHLEKEWEKWLLFAFKLQRNVE
jgi:hypothetical protein